MLAQKDFEYQILLLLGTSEKKRLSVLHIHKEMFLLKESSKSLKPLIKIIKHYRGPFSKQIHDTIDSPMYLEGAWERIFTKNDKLSGGEVLLTGSGFKEYEEFRIKLHDSEDEKLNQIIAGMNLIHDLYDSLSPKELLYMIYTTPKFEKYLAHSDVYDIVVSEETKKGLKANLLIEL